MGNHTYFLDICYLDVCLFYYVNFVIDNNIMILGLELVRLRTVKNLCELVWLMLYIIAGYCNVK